MQHTCNNKVKEKEKEKEIVTMSTLTRHHIESKHEIGWLNSRIIWRDNNTKKLLIEESILIKAYEPELNRRTHSTPLHMFPDGSPK